MISRQYICAFVLHRKAEGEPSHLICRVKWNASRAIVSLNVGFVVEPDKWDPTAQLCRPRTFHGRRKVPAAVINAEIARYRTAVDGVFGEYLKDGIWPDTALLRSDLRVALGIDEPERRGTLDVFDEFVRLCSAENSWSESTMKKMRTTRKHLEAFGGFASVDDFTEDKLARYLTFLRDELHLSNETTERYLRCIRWFCRWAYRKGYMQRNDFDRFRPKLVTAARPVIYLTWDELMRVWDFDPADERRNKVRDIFCFCAFSSLRFSDAQALRWADVFDDHIRVVTQKTADPLLIDLNKWTREVLSRYPRTAPEDPVFPHYANQVFNRMLHLICRDCGMDEPVVLTKYEGSKRTDTVYKKWEAITSHAARRTFIVNALMMGIPPVTVMAWTGHSDYQAMKPYIAVTDQAKRTAMSLFDEKSR